MKYSSAARSLPSGLRIGVTASGHRRVGAIIKKPSGRWQSRPLRTTNVLRCAGLVWISSSSMPIRLHRPTPQGTVVMKLSALCSTWNPCSWTVSSTPPNRDAASNSTKRQPGCNSTSRWAAANPEMPPPITAMRRSNGGESVTSLYTESGRGWAVICRLMNLGILEGILPARPASYHAAVRLSRPRVSGPAGSVCSISLPATIQLDERRASWRRAVTSRFLASG